MPVPISPNCSFSFQLPTALNQLAARENYFLHFSHIVPTSALCPMFSANRVAVDNSTIRFSLPKFLAFSPDWDEERSSMSRGNSHSEIAETSAHRYHPPIWKLLDTRPTGYARSRCNVLLDMISNDPLMQSLQEGLINSTLSAFFSVIYWVQVRLKPSLNAHGIRASCEVS